MDQQRKNLLQKVGGFAAIFHAVAYVVGIGLALTLIAPVLNADAAGYLARMVSLKTVMYLWIFICYSLVSVALVVCVLALYERMKSDSPILMSLASLFGIIWAGLILASGNLMLHDFGYLADLYRADPASAQTVWMALRPVEDGIVSGNEMVGSLWILLLSIAALKNRRLPRALSVFGVVIAVAGLSTLIPAVMEATQDMIFGLGSIAWSAWLGVVLLRQKSE
jgi:hypothetical protein